MVLLANLVGAFAFGWLAAHSGAFSDEAKKEFANLAKQVIQPGFGSLLVRGIVAGWLIALMVWLLPFAESARIWVITFWQSIGGYIVPVLIGNVIGGVALVAFGAHAEFIEASG